MENEIHLWRWRHTDDFGKRRTFPCRLTEANALASLKDPEKIEGSLEVRRPVTPHSSATLAGKPR